MALLTWNSQYAVGVQALDEQHTGLFQALNELHDAMMKGQAQKLTGSLLNKLVDYTRKHFAAEEAMMTSTGYPELPAHREKHRALTRQVEEFVVSYDKGEITLNVQLLNFLREWLTNHIEKTDKEYGPWMNQHGVK
jgi:hemerythrin-like metal-binding protein